RGHGLLGNLQKGTRLLGVRKGLVHRQHDLVGGGNRIHVGCLGAKRRRGNQVVGASEVGNELRQGKPTGGTLINKRVVEIARRNTAPLFRLHRREAAVQVRVVSGLGFPRDLVRSQGKQAVHRDLRIVLQRQRLRVLRREALQRPGGWQLSWRLGAWDGLHLRRRRGSGDGGGRRGGGARLVGGGRPRRPLA